MVCGGSPPHHSFDPHYGATRSYFCAYNTTLLIDPIQVLITQGLHPHPGPTAHLMPRPDRPATGTHTPDIATRLTTTINHLDVEAWDSPAHGVNIAVNNVTCAKTHIADICENKCHFMFLNEVSANPTSFTQLQSKVRENGGHLIGVPLNPSSTSHNVGGVACKTLGSHRATMITPITQPFKEAVAAGRVALFSIDIGGGHTMFVYNTYNYTGGP